MGTEDFTDKQLERLHERWEEAPSSHLTLQLADLYRQRGKLDEAIPILERGLEAQPGRISIQVALGRYRLEGQDAAGASAVLREVVDKDPGHLVANKLLVRAHLALGNRDQARDRLALYSVLNDGDPELDGLRLAVEGGGLSAHGAAEPFAVGTLAPAADLAAVAPPQARRLVGALERVPFAEVVQTPLKPADVTSIFVGEERPPAPEAALPEVEPPVPEPDGDADIDSVVDQVLSAEAVDPVEPVESVESVDPVEFAESAEPVESVESADDDLEAVTELDAGTAATATLGALYLSQGHLEDAQTTFEQVLARDPDDSEALAGLEEIRRQRQPVVVGTSMAEESEVTGLTATRIELLRGYLDRIRAAAERLSSEPS